MQFYFYKIIVGSNCYVGKTRNPSTRLSVHKSNSINSDIPLYRAIRELGGFKNCKFEIIDTQEMSGVEAKNRERELCDIHEATLNVYTPNGNPRACSYYQKNKDKLRVVARNKYEKTKTTWKNPKRTSEEMRLIHIRNIKRTGKIPTLYSRQKHNISDEDVQEALTFFENSRA